MLLNLFSFIPNNGIMISFVYQLVTMATHTYKHGFLGSGKVTTGEHCTGIFSREIPAWLVKPA